MNKLLTSVLASAALLSILAPALQAQQVDANAIQKSLNGVPALELPAKATKLVTAAAPSQMNAVAVAVVEAAIKLRPSSAPAVVAAVIKGAPSVESGVVAAALKAQPQQAGLIRIASISQTATPSGTEGAQPPNNNGKGQGQGGGDGGGQGQGNAYGHLKNYATP